VIGYSYHRGLRFPLLSWEPKEHNVSFSYENLSVDLIDLIQTHDSELSFRAYAPEPEISFAAHDHQQITVKLNNIATDAKRTIVEGDDTPIDERIDGINRNLTFSLKPAQRIKLKWQLPELDDYTFAAIGDTGGDKELAWCIQRAYELGARFLLHLGDFNYQPDDYDLAIANFHNAPLPCYVAIGNHDFNDSGLVYQRFLREIGPLNHQFAIAKTRFVNLDTAASVLPYSAGPRGRQMQQLIEGKDAYADTVAFTHRPLHDPLLGDGKDNDGHDIGSKGERDWLVRSLKQSNIKTLLSGHIHIYDRTSHQGIDNIIAGQGLGHQDLITNSDASKMLIGEVNQHGLVSYTTAPLSMPMEHHCHPRLDEVKRDLLNGPHRSLIEQVNAACMENVKR